MNNTHSLLIAAALACPAFAQEPPAVVETTVKETVTPGKKVVEETVVEKQLPVAPGYDPRLHLSILPRQLPVTPPAPGTKVETTEKTTTVIGGRVYNTERSVVVVEGRELPYVTLPVLFVKETAELLDSESRAALDQTAAVILEITKATPMAVFDIEGHTSTDGTDELNMTLSAARARRVYDELTTHYGIPRSVLSAHGYGESYPMFPSGSEEQMTLDRRVLVVRIK